MLEFYPPVIKKFILQAAGVTYTRYTVQNITRDNEKVNPGPFFLLGLPE
jgi:hypothetical protein